MGNEKEDFRQSMKEGLFVRLLKSRDDYTKNSDEYLAVCKAIEQYNKSFDDEATYDNVVELNKRKGQLLTACDKFVKKKYFGERKALVSSLSELLRNEKSYFDYIPDKQTFEQGGNSGIELPLTIRDIVQNARTRQIDITDKNIEIVGMASSARLMLNEGFFSENDKLYAPTDIKSIEIEKKAIDAHEALPYDSEAVNQFLWDKEITKVSEEARTYLKKQQEGFLTKKYFSYEFSKEIINNINNKLEIGQGLFINNTRVNLIQANGFQNLQDIFISSVKETYGTTEEVAKEIVEFQRRILGKVNVHNLNNRCIGIKSGANLSVRNVATSRLASLLGYGHVIAKSNNATVVKNGKEISKGIIMDKAQGLDYYGTIEERETLSNLIEKNDDIYDAITPNAMKDLVALNIIDMISGQTDRNSGNIFYQVEKQDDGKNKIVGFQGIDNDLSFGVYKIHDKTKPNDKTASKPGVLDNRTLGSLQDINYVDKLMKEKIESINKPILECEFGDILDKDEINALEFRLNQVKDRLNETTVLKIDGDNEWEDFHKYSKSGETNEIINATKEEPSSKQGNKGPTRYYCKYIDNLSGNLIMGKNYTDRHKEILAFIEKEKAERGIANEEPTKTPVLSSYNKLQEEDKKSRDESLADEKKSSDITQDISEDESKEAKKASNPDRVAESFNSLNQQEGSPKKRTKNTTEEKKTDISKTTEEKNANKGSLSQKFSKK